MINKMGKIKFYPGRILYTKATGAPFKLVERKVYVTDKNIFGATSRYYTWVIQYNDGKKEEEGEELLRQTVSVKQPTKGGAMKWARRHGVGMEKEDWRRLKNLQDRYIK